MIENIKEVILCKYGEVVLKGANRSDFEKKMIKELRLRAKRLGNFNIFYSQSTIYIEPTDEEAVEGGGTYPNMFCAHPPFQIDGNFGATNAIAEMFLQSSMDEIHIIPALPKELENASIKGLKAKGNRTVTIIVRGGKLVYCKIKGTPPSRITVKGKDATNKFISAKDGVVYNA